METPTRYPVSKEQKVSFGEKGHIYLSSVASPEDIFDFRPLLNSHAVLQNNESVELKDRDTYGKAFLQTMNLWQNDPGIKAFTFSKRYAQIAADLLGVKKVRLYHDQSLVKEPGGGFTPWHQDQFYWPLDTSKTITMWMPLVDIEEGMGLLTFASTSHKNGLVGNEAISDHSESYFNSIISSNQYPLHKENYMKAGDATFHHGCTIHGAGPNNSGVMREVMTIIYFEDEARVTTPVNEFQKNDRATWLDNILPGQPADSYLNPVLN